MRIRIGSITVTLRKSMVPEREPRWFHDYHRFIDGTFQLGFFIWLLFVTKEDE